MSSARQFMFAIRFRREKDEQIFNTINRVDKKNCSAGNYNLFLDGYSMRNIKKVLESGGFLTATGKKTWNESLISSILKNEKYVGDALMQKTYTLDCITHKVVKNHGERPMYLVTDHHDPIVDRQRLLSMDKEFKKKYAVTVKSEDVIYQSYWYIARYFKI